MVTTYWRYAVHIGARWLAQIRDKISLAQIASGLVQFAVRDGARPDMAADVSTAAFKVQATWEKDATTKTLYDDEIRYTGAEIMYRDTYCSTDTY